MSSTRLRISTLLTLYAAIQPLHAQQCYYPNGSPVTAEPVGPCYSWGGACCPVGWTCLSNNLCAYKNQTGRYSCVDREWGDSCPSFCRDENGSEGGDQAVQDCGDGSYCCNGRGAEGDRCCETGANFFKPGPGKAVRTIASVAAGRGDVGGDGETATASGAGTTRTTTMTQTTQSVVSSEGRAPTTVQVTVVSFSLVTPAVASATAGVPASPTSGSNEILQKAIGIPVGILAGLLIIAGVYLAAKHARRRKEKKHPSPYSGGDAAKEDEGTMTPSNPTTAEFVGMSPISRRSSTVMNEDDVVAGLPGSSAGGTGGPVSELGGTEIMQLHEEPQIAELPAEGSGRG